MPCNVAPHLWDKFSRCCKAHFFENKVLITLHDYLWKIVTSSMHIFADESDEEEDRPSRKRRLAERAVEGEAAEDEEVC